MGRFKEFFHREREKIKDLSVKAKAEYIWQYYKLWIIGVAAVVLFAAYVVVHRLTVPADNWFYVLFANTYADVTEGSELWEGFVEYTGFDTSEKNVYFNNSCYFDPFSTGYSEYYISFVAYVEAGTLDVVTMETEDLAELGRYGWLLDLSSEQAEGLAEKYADRLIYAVPDDEENGTDPIPIGIDLSDTCLVTKYQIYEESCAVGISANAPHMDAIELFLDYIIEEDTE